MGVGGEGNSPISSVIVCYSYLFRPFLSPSLAVFLLLYFLLWDYFASAGV